MLHSIVIILVILNGYTDAQQLIGTHIIFRHGERTPSYLYPTNPNTAQSWPNGLSQLTVRGRLQQIALGQYIRERYSTLLNSTYVASEITVRSSDYDRTLASAYANLVGIYSSPNNIPLPENIALANEWPKTLPWEPIPVHTVPKPLDHLIGVSQCEKYEKLVEELRESSRIQSLNHEFQDLFKYLEEHTNQSIADIFIAWDIADTTLIEHIYNITPTWVTPPILEQLRRLSELCFYHLLYPPEINRLRGGPLISEILQNIAYLKSNNEKGRKVKMYSGHDTTIAAVLSYLGVNYVHQPPFASALFFDVYQQDDNTYVIQLEYSNMTYGRNAHVVRLPGCEGTMCSLDTFIQLYGARLPDDIDKECKSDDIDEESESDDIDEERQSNRFKRKYPRIHHVSFASE